MMSKNVEESLPALRAMARKYARRYPWAELEEADHFQNGFFGLMTADERFDPSRGAAFWTFARNWVNHAMQRALENTGTTVRIPTFRGQSIRRASCLGPRLDDEVTDESTYGDLLCRTEATQEDDAYGAELTALVSRTLTAKQLEIVVLSLEEWQQYEMATVLRRSAATISAGMQKARKRMARVLEEAA